MSSKSEDQKNAVISIVGTVLFAVLTILLPLLKVLGGFLTYSESTEILSQTVKTSVDYYWDKVTGSILGISLDYTYNQYVDQGELSAEIIWQIIPLWGLIWLILGIIGVVLVILPAFQKLLDQEPIRVGKIGLGAGLIATVGEYGLFIIAWVLEDWETTTPNINIILLACFVIGWIGLIIGYIFAMKES
ncbi:MAG: hypothetical protein ACFFB2_20415 [Promethearchaeota archaeon]